MCWFVYLHISFDTFTRTHLYLTFAHQLFHLINLCWNWFSSFNKYAINPSAMLPTISDWQIHSVWIYCIDQFHHSNCIKIFDFYDSWTLNKNNEQTFIMVIQLICHTLVRSDWNVNETAIYMFSSATSEQSHSNRTKSKATLRMPF